MESLKDFFKTAVGIFAWGTIIGMAVAEISFVTKKFTLQVLDFLIILSYASYLGFVGAICLIAWQLPKDIIIQVFFLSFMLLVASGNSLWIVCLRHYSKARNSRWTLFTYQFSVDGNSYFTNGYYLNIIRPELLEKISAGDKNLPTAPKEPKRILVFFHYLDYMLTYLFVGWLLLIMYGLLTKSPTTVQVGLKNVSAVFFLSAAKAYFIFIILLKENRIERNLEDYFPSLLPWKKMLEKISDKLNDLNFSCRKERPRTRILLHYLDYVFTFLFIGFVLLFIYGLKIKSPFYIHLGLASAIMMVFVSAAKACYIFVIFVSEKSMESKFESYFPSLRPLKRMVDYLKRMVGKTRTRDTQ